MRFVPRLAHVRPVRFCGLRRLLRRFLWFVDLVYEPTRRSELLSQNPVRAMLLEENLEAILLPADDAAKFKVPLFERGAGQRNQDDQNQGTAEAEEHASLIGGVRDRGPDQPGSRRREAGSRFRA